jgi:hypothetical protein
MPPEVSMADNGSHWKDKENKTQKIKISCSLVTVLMLKQASWDCVSHNDTLDNLDQPNTTNRRDGIYIYI